MSVWREGSGGAGRAGHEVLRWAAGWLGVGGEGLVGSGGAGPGGDWVGWVKQSAAGYGLRVQSVSLPVGRVAGLAEAHGPLVTMAPGGRWVVVVGEARGDCLRVQVGAEQQAQVERGALVELLGSGEPEWVILEPSLPLDGLRDDSHGMTPFQRLRRLLESEKADLRAVVIYAVVTGVLSLAVPVAVQAVVGSIAFNVVLQPLVVLTVVVLLALLFEGALRLLQAHVVERLQQRLFVKVAADAAERLSRVRASSLRHSYAPELVNRFFDVVTVQKAAAALLLDGVGLVLQAAAGLLLLAFYHPLLLAFDIVLVGCLLALLFGLTQEAVRTAVKESKEKYHVASWLEEIARHSYDFRSTSSRAYALGRLDALASGHLTYRRKHWVILLWQSAGVRVLYALSSAALLGVGGLLVIERQLTLGQLVASELIVTAVLSGVAKFAKHLESYYDLVAAVDKLGYLVDLPLEESGSSKAVWESKRGARLEVRGSTPLQVESGGRAVVSGGDSGARTALLESVYGLDSESGLVLVDGLDLRQLDRSDYRSQVALVREGQVFDGTIEDNLRVGQQHLSASDLHRALADVGLLDEVLALPEGLQTHLLASGAPLSRSQTQRLALARALVARPRLLLVDHALDGLDDPLLGPILQRLTVPDAPWTLVVATGREVVAKWCGGNVAEVAS